MAYTLTKLRQLINLVHADYDKKRPQIAPENGYYEKILHKKGLSNTGMDCLKKQQSHYPWRHLKDVLDVHSRTLFSGGLVTVRLRVGLDLRCPFHHKLFYVL